MTHSKNITRLCNWEDEDIFDVVMKLEVSLGLEFGEHTFSKVQTFGDMCDVIINCVRGDYLNDCTTQQAFYKIRDAIATTQNLDKNAIKPEDKLADLFPRRRRTQKMKHFKSKFDTPINILDIKSWLGYIIFWGVIASLILFFFKWQYAILGLLLFAFVGWVSYKYFAKEFTVKTVGALSEKMARDHYVEFRREKSTLNRNEVLDIIIDTFSFELQIDKMYLTRSEKFNWTG